MRPEITDGQIHNEALPIFLGHNVFYVLTIELYLLVTERNAQHIRFINLGQRSFLVHRSDTTKRTLSSAVPLCAEEIIATGIPRSRSRAQWLGWDRNTAHYRAKLRGCR